MTKPRSRKSQLDVEAICEAFEDAHPDTEQRFSAVMKNMLHQPLSDEDKRHLAQLREDHSID